MTERLPEVRVDESQTQTDPSYDENHPAPDPGAAPGEGARLQLPGVEVRSPATVEQAGRQEPLGSSAEATRVSSSVAEANTNPDEAVVSEAVTVNAP